MVSHVKSVLAVPVSKESCCMRACAVSLKSTNDCGSIPAPTAAETVVMYVVNLTPPTVTSFTDMVVTLIVWVLESYVRLLSPANDPFLLN